MKEEECRKIFEKILDEKFDKVRPPWLMNNASLELD